MAEPTKGYDEMTLTELQEVARARDIAGRSSMNLEELRAAVTADAAAGDGDDENAGDDPAGDAPDAPEPGGAAAAVAEAPRGSFEAATRATPITASASGRPH